MPLEFVKEPNPQSALGVFFALAGFEFAERETSCHALFHRVYPSVANDQYVLLRDSEDNQYIGAAAWYECSPAYAAIVLNETRPITAAEARAGDKPHGRAIIWHTMLAPYGETAKLHSLLKNEIMKITNMPSNEPLYQTYKGVKKSYNLIQLKAGNKASGGFPA